MKEEIESIMNKAFHTRRGESIIGVKEAAEEISKLFPKLIPNEEPLPDDGEVYYSLSYRQRYWISESHIKKLLPKEVK